MSSLAACLARAVSKGYLPIEHAHAAIAATVARGMRENALPGTGTLEERIRIDAHILALNIRNIEAARERAAGAIVRALRPLISIRAKSNKLRAVAHDANSECGLPLSEVEVEEVAKVEVWRAMQRSRKYG